MGRFVRNQFGQDVYVPSVEELGGPASPIPWAPIDPTSLSDLAAPISGMGVVPDIEREQPIIYDRENLQFENLLLTEEENERMRQLERDKRALENLGINVNDRPFMQVQPGRLQDTAVGRVVDQNRAQEQKAERQQILQETNSRRRKENEKYRQNRSRKDAMLNSPEAREMVSKIQQGLADEEDFKANWVKDKTHAWDVSIEGDAYQELWAQLNQDSTLAKKAGEFLGKTVEDPDRTAVGSEIRDEFYAKLEQEHNQRELEKETRLENRHMPGHSAPIEYAPKPFDPYSRESREEVKDRIGQFVVSNRVEEQIANLEQLTKDLANAETARSQASTGFGPGSMFGTPELAHEEDLIIKTNQAQREWRKLQDQIHKHLDDPFLSDKTKRHFVSLLHESGKRLVEADVNSRYEIRLKEKVNTLANTNYWKNLEQKKGRKLGQEEKMQYLRDTDTPMEMFLEEQTHKQLSKHRKAAALKSIQNSLPFKILSPLGSTDTGFQVLLAVSDGITGLLKIPVSAGAAAGVPGFTKTGGELSDFLEDQANAVDIYTKDTLGDGRSLKTLGLNPHQFRGVVTSIYQSMVLGGFGLGHAGVATGFGLTSAADEYQRGIDEGLSRGTASLYAGIQGVFEGGIEYALPGTNKWAANLMTRGVLNQSAKKSIKVVAPTIKKRFIDFAKTIGQEQASEALTTITQLFAEGSFIHEDKSFFAKQIGPALLETVETVFAQTMLMGGGGNLVSGRNRRLKATIAERNRRYQERLDRMYGKLAPLTGQIRTSGSLSDRMAEVINRISPAGAAQLRKLREQGKQISRTAIEKLYGPEIAGRLTKLEQREAFADAILGQKQRVQQEVADNSPVLQESPTKVVEVENQQTGEKNVVTVNVEQGQTAQEAVDAQVRTATGEAPVVITEPDTESLSIRDPESIMEEIKGLEDSIINPETTPAERETFEKRKKVLKQALNKRLSDRKKETPETEAPADALPEAPTEAPAEGPFYESSKNALDEGQVEPGTDRAVNPLQKWDEETHGPATDAFGELLNPGDVIEDAHGSRYVVKANGMLAQLKDDGSESGTYFRLRKRKSRDTAAEYEADTDARTLLATSRLVEKTEGASWPAEMKRKKEKSSTEATPEVAPETATKESPQYDKDGFDQDGVNEDGGIDPYYNNPSLRGIKPFDVQSQEALTVEEAEANLAELKESQKQHEQAVAEGDIALTDDQSNEIAKLEKRIAIAKQRRGDVAEAPTLTEATPEAASVPAAPSTFEVGPGAREDASRPVFKPRTMTPEQQRELYEFSRKPGVRLKDITDKYDEIMGTTPDEKAARRQQAFVLYGESEAGNWASGIDKGTTVGTVTKDGALVERHGGSGRSNTPFSASDPDAAIVNRTGRDRKEKEKMLEVLYPGARFREGIATGFSQQGTVSLPTATPAPAKTQASGKTKPQPAKKQKGPPSRKATPPPRTTPTEATPAEKQQQKADKAKKELGEAFRDMMGGMQAAPWSNKPNAELRQKFIEKLANYLYEQAKTTGLKVTELAKKWYNENSKAVKTEEKQNLKKIVTEAAINADERIKKEPSKKPTPTPEGEFSEEVYSIKNANVDADLEALNLPKPTPAEELAFQETLDEAVTATTDDADSLVSDLLDNPRAPSPWENALLTVAYMRAKKNYDNAKKRLAELSGQGGTAESDAKKALDAAHKKYEDVYMASRLTGRESGRSLAFRRMMIREDYSLVNMEYEARISNEGELSKKQKEEVAELQKRIEELQSQLGDVESRRNNNKAEEKFKAEDEKIRRQTKKRKPGKAKIVTDDARDAAIERIKKRRQTTLTSGVNPEDIYDATLIGVNLLENGVNKFSAWSSQIVDIVGDTIKPHLKDMWKDARSQVAQLFVDETSSTLAQANKEEKPINYNRQARKIYKEFVAMGQDRDTALKSTHEVFNDAVEEDFTIEQVRDFVSGYGVFSELSKEELEVQTRAYVGELQQLAKIEAMLRGEAPLKTGQERREASDEERRLLKEVERLKKLGGYSAVDPAKALQTALASIKTRLENQIRDLQAAIDTKTPINNETSTVELDAEAESLKKERDALMAVYKEMFPSKKKALTPEQRIRVAEKALERAIERNKKRIQGKDIGPVKGKKARSARLDALRAENEALLAELRALRPKLTQEQKDTRRKITEIQRKIKQRKQALASGEYKTEQRQSEANMKDPTLQKLIAAEKQLSLQFKAKFGPQMALDQEKARVKRQIADIKARIASGQFSTEKKSPQEKKDDDEMRQLRLEEMNAKREFNKLKAKYEWDNMRWLGKKPLMVASQLYDAVRTMKASIDFSGFRQAAFASMVHPVMALKAGGKMFTGAWSEKKRLAIEDELQKDPFYDEAKKNGVAFTERDGDLSQREEEYMAQWISSGVKAKTKAGQAWQVATYPYAVSERAFSTLLNVMRLEYYKSITSGLPLNQAEKGKLARFVNSATGRGDIGALGPGGTKFLTRLIWAPKLLVSRWNILTGTHFFGTERGGTTLQTRKVIFMQYAMAMRSIGTLLMLAAASRWSDDEDEWTNFIDPRSSKFGTIKIGNTYVDPWGGMKQLTVFIARTLPAAPGIVGLPDILGRPARRNWEGELVYLDEGVYGQNLMNTIGRFAQTKLNPTAGILVAAGQNYDMMGRPMTGGRMIYELITPLAPQEGLVAMKEEGIPTGAFLGLLGMMGASLMIDDEENLSSYEQILDMLGFDPLEGPKEKKKAERERKKIIDARRKKRNKSRPNRKSSKRKPRER